MQPLNAGILIQHSGLELFRSLLRFGGVGIGSQSPDRQNAFCLDGRVEGGRKFIQERVPTASCDFVPDRLEPIKNEGVESTRLRGGDELPVQPQFHLQESIEYCKGTSQN
jgi:hypothetical protein